MGKVGISLGYRARVLAGSLVALTRQLGRLASGLQIVRDGANLFIADPKVYPDLAIVAFGGWEMPQRTYLMTQVERLTGPDGTFTFLDIGAYAGSYAMMFARHPRCTRVLAFEPDQRNRRHLAANLFLNGLADRVEIDPRAVSSNRREASLRRSEHHPNANRGGIGLRQPGAIPGQTVETVPLDDILDATGETFVVKIDVEGHQFRVLAGMERLLARNRCLLQIEMIAAHQIARSQTWLEARGYRRIHAIEHDIFFEPAGAPVSGSPAIPPASRR
jgi:FkbM family methyltransferase